MAENEVESVAEEIVNEEEVNNNVIDSVDDTRDTLNDEHRKIVERLSKIMLERKTSDDIMFKKVDKETLKVQTNRVNEAIKYFKSKSITEINDLIKAANVWVAEQIGLKKKNYRKKNEPTIPHINSETNPPPHDQCCLQVSETVSRHKLWCCLSSNILQH